MRDHREEVTGAGQAGRPDSQPATDGYGEGRHGQVIKAFSPQRCQRIITRLVLRRGKPGRSPPHSRAARCPLSASPPGPLSSCLMKAC